MIGAGTFINPLIKIVTTFAILGAVYLFFVKPALDTTKQISDGFSQSIDRNLGGAFRSLDSAEQAQVKRAIRKANISRTTVTHIPASAGKQLKIVRCIQRANGDVPKIQACAR